MTASLSLRSARLLLRPPREEDLDALANLLAGPETARWWPGFDRARVQAELIAPAPDLTVLILESLEQRGQIAGAIQFSEEEDPQYRHASVDLFLGFSWQGRGLGPEAIRAVVDHLFRARGHHRIVIDPAAHNDRAIRAYEKVGFRRVGVMRRYERGADGTWHDGLLMELLSE